MTKNQKKVISGLALWLYDDYELDLEWYWNTKRGAVEWADVLKAVNKKDKDSAEALAEILEYEGVFS
jgi:hypothetical protein